MSVTSCRIQYEDQMARIDQRHVEQVPVKWLITTDSRQDGPKTVRTQAQSVGPDPLPDIYDAYNIPGDYDPSMLVRDIELRRVPNSDLHWHALVTYDNTLDINQQGGPFDRAPIDSWDVEQFQRMAQKQIDDTAVVNSAGTPIDVEIDDSRPILTYTRNEPTYPVALLTYQDAINSDTFLGIFPPYTAKVNIRAQKQFEDGVTYYATTYSFHFRWDTWRPKVKNAGYFYRPSAGKRAVQSPSGDLKLLKDDGTILAIGADPTFTTLKLYRELPFASLNIVIY